MTWSPGFASISPPAAACTGSSFRARPAPSRQAASPTAIASSRLSVPLAGAVTTWVSRAVGIIAIDPLYRPDAQRLAASAKENARR